MHPLSAKAIARAPRFARTPVELVVRTVENSFRDRIPGLSAEVAFFVLLSMPPLLFTLLATLGAIGSRIGATWQADVGEAIRSATQVVFSAEAGGVLDRTVDALLQESSGTVIGAGFVLTLFSASRALRVIMTAITLAYDLEPTRTGWQQRLWGLGLTLGSLIVGLVVIPVLVAGPGLGQGISDEVGGVPGLGLIWRTLYWPSAVVLVTLLLTTLYHLAAPWSTPFRRDLPGAALAMLLWLGGTVGLRAYAAAVLEGAALYQPIAGPLVVLLWLYVSGFSVLVGAELNAQIERMWPSQPLSDDQPTSTTSQASPASSSSSENENSEP
jgi:membrane protein